MPARPADNPEKLAVLNEVDPFAGLRNGLRSLAAERHEWAGYPMPLQGMHLVVEPKYPKARELMDMFRDPKIDPETEGYKVRNSWFSISKRGRIIVVEKDGKIEWFIEQGIHHFYHDLQTLMCSTAWGIEQESNAVHLLGSLLRHHQFKQYLLTGMFMEKSRRSGLTYLFRKLRPTVVIDARDESSTKSARILCCLCMHPIAYYEGSWGGAMTPTDDVIAHLTLMRADEVMLWRRANQHPSWHPNAGLGA